MLTVQNVSKKYAGKTALSNVNLVAGQGKITGLLGPNGAGKTSLIRIITRITAPDEGIVLLNDRLMDSTSSKLIGYLPEERGLYRKMSILDQARYFARLKGMSNRDCDAAINLWFDRLEMTGWKNKKLEELSKGMQQKVQFAITVLHQPRLIILDEPFTGFDPLNAELIKNEILALKRAGACILLSTHRMESVEELCDEIALINQGEVILNGQVEEVRQRFNKSEYVFRYNGELPEQIPGVISRQNEILTNGQTKSTFVFENRANVKEVLHFVNEQVRIHEFSEKLPTIKDIFIDRLSQPS
jgi:ABC-2 type transport system ATP-binding protein